MKTMRRILGLLVMTLALAAATAEAASVFTTAAALRSGSAFACLAVNAGTRDIGIIIEVMNSDGTPANGMNGTVAPGEALVTEVPSFGGTLILYCRFTVFEGNRSALRGSYCVRVLDNFDCKTTGDAR